MSFTATTSLTAIALFVFLLAFLELGRRLGIALANGREGGIKGAGAVEGAVFGLLGLILAFTFSGAANRFDVRRQLINAEASAIGTAYLRLDLLDGDVRAVLQDQFRRYLDVRLETYRNAEDETATRAKLAEGATLQNVIWTQSLAEAKKPGATPSAAMLLLPALNQMFDTAMARDVATQNHPPKVIYALLYALSLVAALLAGVSMSSHPTRSWLHMVLFSTMISITLFVVLDIERPLVGLIRIDGADQVLIELRANLK
jgi:hypothetical protein